MSLASPDLLTCAACHYHGRPPAEASRSLRAAGEVLFQTDVRRRQLSDSLRRALVSAAQRHARFLLIFALTSVPITLFCAVMLLGLAVSPDGDGDAMLGAMVVAAWLGTVGTGATWTVLVRRRQRRLEDACAARPPSAPGEPAACHVCGAPLGQGAEGIARCRFCGADNLVAAPVLERARARQALVFQSFEQAVSAEMAAFTRATSGAGAALVASAVGVPAAVFILMLVLVLAADARRRPVDGTVRYAVVSTPVGRCIGKLQARAGGGAAVLFTAWRFDGLPAQLVLEAGAPLETFGAKEAIGRRVRTNNEDTGTIEEVFSSPFTGNTAVLRLKDDKKATHSLAGTCLVPGPDDRAP